MGCSRPFRKENEWKPITDGLKTWPRIGEICIENGLIWLISITRCDKYGNYPSISLYVIVIYQLETIEMSFSSTLREIGLKNDEKRLKSCKMAKFRPTVPF